MSKKRSKALAKTDAGQLVTAQVRREAVLAIVDGSVETVDGVMERFGLSFEQAVALLGDKEIVAAVTHLSSAVATQSDADVQRWCGFRRR